MINDRWEEAYKHAERHFQNHEATLIQDSDRYTIIDWRNKNKSSDYYINFIVDKKRGSLIVSGDLGESIAIWYNQIKISDLKKYIYKDIEYYMSKFQCASNRLDFDSDEVLDYLIQELFDDDEAIYNYFIDHNDYLQFREEMQEEIEKSLKDADSAFYPTDRLFEMVTDVYDDAWELLDNPAAKIDLRVYLWAIGFYMACDQLGI